jgi:hypothetical protein
MFVIVICVRMTRTALPALVNVQTGQQPSNFNVVPGPGVEQKAIYCHVTSGVPAHARTEH